MGDTNNLQHHEAVGKMQEMVKHIDTCMFCTSLAHIPFQVRPMSTADIDDDGNFWFFSNKESDKNLEIAENNKVQLLYAHPGKEDYLSVMGTAHVIVDREKVEELWNPIVKAWFPGGKDDPNISLIKITPETAHYWDTKSNKWVSFLKIMTAAITGSTMDDGVQGSMEI